MSYFTLESHDTLLFCHLTAFLFHKSINTLLPTFPSLPNQISFLSLKSLNFLYLINVYRINKEMNEGICATKNAE